MVTFLTYEDSIYLLGYYLRSNIIGIEEALAKDEQDWDFILTSVAEVLVGEFDITDPEIAGAVVEMWKDSYKGA